MDNITEMANVLIILGMHRSGTSLISEWLNKCGLNLGDKLLGASFFNKKGHFEDIDFLNLHQEILAKYNINESGLIPPFDFELNDHYYQQLKANIKLKSSLHEQWGWKDPRTCLFIDFYKKLLPQAKYIIVYRDYEFVVESLVRREYLTINLEYHALTKSEQLAKTKYFEAALEKIQSSINNYLLAWVIYNQRILDLVDTVKEDSYIALRYDSFTANDARIFERLRKWDFKLKYYPFSSVFDPDMINEIKPDITFDPQLETTALQIRYRMLSLLDQQQL